MSLTLFRRLSPPSGIAPFLALVLFATSALVSSPCYAQQSVWDIKKQGAFVMSSLVDSEGCYWFGTEDKGIWRYDPDASDKDAWKQFTTKEGLGDDHAYALAVDWQGRVWAGHQSHGVSVWNGRGWRNYDVLEGPYGERVFDIAISPLDGGVWIATSRGIAVYDVLSSTWSYQTRLTGLPSDQIQTLAFDAKGTVYVGTQCDGLVIARPKTSGKNKGSYGDWEQIKGWPFMPPWSAGDGIPSNLINDILIGRDGTVYVATTYGLARSRNSGQSWGFLRGKDWKDKVKGLAFPPPILPQPERDLLTEDYVTTLAEDSAGNLWLGHPNKGIEVRSPGGDFFGGGGVVETPDQQLERKRREKLAEQVEALGDGPRVTLGPDGRPRVLPPPIKIPGLSQEEKTDYVNSILPIEGEAPLVCGNGSGVIQLGRQVAAPIAFRSRKLSRRETQAQAELLAAIEKPGTFPKPAAPPRQSDLQDGLALVAALKTPLKKLSATYVGEDWKTKGDWMGRYGRDYALLCSMGAPLDHRVVSNLDYLVEGRLGPHPYLKGETYDKQGLRHWMHTKRWDDPRVLYNPLLGYRRQADSDDNGEAYPGSYEGPDIWMGVRVPKGTHRVALYFFNKDGHAGMNRVRDYIIDVKAGSESVLRANEFPILARTRVRDFWGGVYKIFTVQGPEDYYFVMRKNNSFNTIVQAVLLDQVAGEPSRWANRRDIWLGDTRFEPPAPEKRAAIERAALARLSADRRPYLQAALDLWAALDGSQDLVGSSEQQLPLRLLCYRALQSLLPPTSARPTQPEGVKATLAGTEQGKVEASEVQPEEPLEILARLWRWDLPLWPEADRKEFKTAMEVGWKRFNQINPHWKNGVR